MKTYLWEKRNQQKDNPQATFWIQLSDFIIFRCFDHTQLISEQWSRYLEISLEMLEKCTSPKPIPASSSTSVLHWDLLYQPRHGKVLSSAAGAQAAKDKCFLTRANSLNKFNLDLFPSSLRWPCGTALWSVSLRRWDVPCCCRLCNGPFAASRHFAPSLPSLCLPFIRNYAT